MDAVTKPTPAEDDRDILTEARKRFEYSESVDSENRKNARADTEFVWVKGKQWPDSIRNQREAEDRPWLEINQLPQFINQVVNDQRMGRPGIRTNPASGDASEEVADILQGMIRHIEYESNAEAAYDSAFAHAVTGGRGYWRVCSEYEDGKSFNQKLCIKRVPDPLSVRMDPDYQDPDAGDAAWCFVCETIQKDEFQRRWPDADEVSWDVNGEGLANWYDGADKVVVADYYRRVTFKRTLVAMSDGAVGWKDELPKDLPPGIEVLREREAEDCTVEWFKVAGGEQILERYDWPGKYIPVIMCVGDEIMVEGKRIFQGLIRRARDVQTMYNFWQTAATEMIAMAPRSPYVAAFGQIEGFENDWQNANKANIPVLQYNPISAAGTQVPPPQRTGFASVPTGIVEQANQCKQDLRATIGIYDPSLGMRSNETSGRAIVAREKQGDTATFHFVDNLTRAIALTGRILVDLIPAYYDTARIVGTIDLEDEREMVSVNQPVPDPNDFANAIVQNDLSVGKYAVTVDAGPNYATRRQEAADSMMQFIQAYPPAAQVAGDLIAKNMDWPGAEQIAARLKVLLPPQIQQAESQEGPPIPPQVAQQMSQMQQAIQQMQQALQQATQENQQLKSGVAEKVQIAEMENQRKMADMASENQRREQDAMMRASTTIREAQIAADAKLKVAEIDGQVKLALAQLAPAPEGVMASDPTGLGPQQLPQALMAMAEGIHRLAAVHAAPRQSKLVLDEQGNPVGAVSQPMVQ